MTGPTPQALPPQALAQLQQLLGKRLRGGEQARALDAGWHAANLDAGWVALPESVAQLAEVLRCCQQWRVPIVPQGGRTGLVGGAVSSPGQLIVSTAGQNRIERIDPVSRVAVVQAGVTLQALQEAAAEHGLEPGIDLAARGSATVGGMLATNAGGVMAFRHGVMRHRVLGLQAVLADGRVFSDLTEVVKNAAGYDLKHLFIGAEGTLGIITCAVIALEPLPAASATVLLGLPSTQAMLHALRLALAIDHGHLRAAEALWPDYLQLTAQALHWQPPDMSLDCPIYLLLELGGNQEEHLQQALEALFAQVIEQHPQAQGLVASSVEQAQTLWRLREDTESIYRQFPRAPSFDVSVPLGQMPHYLDAVLPGLERLRPGVQVFVFGHVADGNLHIVLGEPGPLAAEAMQGVEQVLYAPLRGLGGSFSAEHGIGSYRIGALENSCDPVKMQLMQALKRQWDPHGLMNPGKVLGPRAAAQG